MSIVLVSTQTNNMGTGVTPLTVFGNIVINDITAVLSQFSASTGTEVIFAAQLQAENSSGSITSIQQFRFVLDVTPSQILFPNQVIQRSFPSQLMLDLNSQLQFNVTAFSNLVEANLTFDITGFLY